MKFIFFAYFGNKLKGEKITNIRYWDFWRYVCYTKLAQGVCSKAQKHRVLVRYNKANFGYICKKNDQKI